METVFNSNLHKYYHQISNFIILNKHFDQVKIFLENVDKKSPKILMRKNQHD